MAGGAGAAANRVELVRTRRGMWEMYMVIVGEALTPDGAVDVADGAVRRMPNGAGGNARCRTQVIPSSSKNGSVEEDVRINLSVWVDTAPICRAGGHPLCACARCPDTRFHLFEWCH